MPGVNDNYLDGQLEFQHEPVNRAPGLLRYFFKHLGVVSVIYVIRQLIWRRLYEFHP